MLEFIMYIDASNMTIEEVLTKLRDTVRMQPADEADVELYVPSRDYAVKIKAFASFSGNTVDVAREGDSYFIKITGGSCNACR